ncbi:MAG: hydrogenase maturation nickel metallochaperone HypA [Bacteriovoracaceae bacterium]|nr:hydrogenase maturation nickel metallochaperone HypA [Bacteriovoracaceae bacterium]
MHELSLAIELVDLCEKEINLNDKVYSVELEIGPFSGVDKRAFQFAWSEATKDSLLFESNLVINDTRGLLSCNSCHIRFESPDLITICPSCDSVGFEIIKGREFKVLTLEIIDVP